MMVSLYKISVVIAIVELVVLQNFAGAILQAKEFTDKDV